MARRLKLPSSFPKLSISLNGVSARQALGPTLASVGILVVLLLFLSGTVSLKSWDQGGNADIPDLKASMTTQVDNQSERAFKTIRVAAFFFDQVAMDLASSSKNDDQWFRDLVEILRPFDVIAVQGIDQERMQAFQRWGKAVGQAHGRYQVALSDHAGSHSRYHGGAFFWDHSRVQLIPGSLYLVDDPGQRLRVPPMVASFESRAGEADGRAPFRFSAIQMWHQPNFSVAAESPAMPYGVVEDVFVRVRRYEFEQVGEDDCLLVCNMNLQGESANGLSRIPSLIDIASSMNQVDVAAASQVPGHLWLDRQFTGEFTGTSGSGLVDSSLKNFAVANRLGLKSLVWAEFSCFEQPRFEKVARFEAGASIR
ncbi:hypothetical protein OAE79_02830 [Rhodopirellula sp.]|nr:hypothetical protein [Rhodopirellula sp.]MDB4679253.1 hypothetical protein [Rhodopirellula sp.]